ncbi:hypothetical protein DY251_07250 [Mesorhizobium denitrificans]|uniref:DUF1127 domain-containing protein n=2 Tax=Phyllobacteriaceae TaxID=69277 RepID=A0A371XGB8_9HYPH|nr:hypothetical protein DY251_07250 [Mesorhizobium denitrificans]
MIEHKSCAIVKPSETPGRLPDHKKEQVMGILSAFSYIAKEYSRTRTRYQTERLLHALPFEVQKDIGWPQPEDTRRTVHTKTAH